MRGAGSPAPNSAARARAPSRALIKTHAGAAARRPGRQAVLRGARARAAHAAQPPGGARGWSAGRGAEEGRGEGRRGPGEGERLGGARAGVPARGASRRAARRRPGWVPKGFIFIRRRTGGVLRVPPVQASRQLRRPAARASGGVARGSVRYPEWAGGGNGVRVGAGAHTRLRPHRERRRWRAAAAEARACALRLSRRQQQERQRRGGERLWRREQQEAEAEAAAGTWDDPVRGCEHQRG